MKNTAAPAPAALPDTIAPETIDALLAVAEFQPRSATRAKGTYLACNTPAEFFANPQHIVKLTQDIGRRFARSASFVRADDFSQNAALVVMECAQRWTPEKRVQFGGYAYRSAELWCIGAMYRASVPVSGPLDSRAVVESIHYDSLDEQAGDGESTTTLGALLGWESTETGETHRPDDALDRKGLHATLNSVLSRYALDVQDALLGILAGSPPEKGEALPEGYTLEGLHREARRLRVDLAGLFGRTVPVESEEIAEAIDADDPWLARGLPA